jgi:hypothetical protein
MSRREYPKTPGQLTFETIRNEEGKARLDGRALFGAKL